jgi:ABC-2 type transport system ATP-binding protein
MADMPLVNEIQEMDGGFRLKTTRGEKALPRIFQRISKLKVEVQSVSMKKPSLDGVFLELTGRRLRDVQEDRVARELTMKRTRE